jgi:hypothetical protein
MEPGADFIKIILGTKSDMPEMGGHGEHGEHGPQVAPTCESLFGQEADWKQIADQLLEAISLIDTHTDGWEAGTEDAEGALKAIDNETSRILWGKQEDDNPQSSYQNANYSDKTSNGLMMENPADLFGDVPTDIPTGKEDEHGFQGHDQERKEDEEKGKGRKEAHRL